jgi:hypothetical protein
LGEQVRSEGREARDGEVETIRGFRLALTCALYVSGTQPVDWTAAARRSHGWAAIMSVRRGSSARRSSASRYTAGSGL